MGLAFGVQGVVFRVQVLGFRVQDRDSGFRVQGSGLRDSGFRGLGCRVSHPKSS